MRNCGHQSLRRVNVEGIKPTGTDWYECKCGQRLLVQIIASSPQDWEDSEAKKQGIVVEKLFLAEDQTSWGSLQQAKARNDLLNELLEIESFLLPRTQELEDGKGYLQQELVQIEEVRSRLLRLVARAYKKDVKSGTTLQSLITAIADDLIPLDEDPIYKLYVRLACMDREGREWQTPELAEHPEMAKQVELPSGFALPHNDSKEDSYERREEGGQRRH